MCPALMCPALPCQTMPLLLHLHKVINCKNCRALHCVSKSEMVKGGGRSITDVALFC